MPISAHYSLRSRLPKAQRSGERTQAAAALDPEAGAAQDRRNFPCCVGPRVGMPIEPAHRLEADAGAQPRNWEVIMVSARHCDLTACLMLRPDQRPVASIKAAGRERRNDSRITAALSGAIGSGSIEPQQVDARSRWDDEGAKAGVESDRRSGHPPAYASIAREPRRRMPKQRWNMPLKRNGTCEWPRRLRLAGPSASVGSAPPAFSSVTSLVAQASAPRPKP